ncbi:RsmF rRNA methyltransferase first C-terminal domain-containing protein [Paenibacillus cremeus]|uniref:RNA methyltransferase n=1 Tax=Paenibacillus cremeus TaxID=2163881 RepID=A0A559K824_9BACL|nr:RsmF rRNA methyltransferase first C-terminal domain-containing protein [Paenibacillus cremeus]TVY08281.1 RNA methyltransferase [Paenibacillus cremeus]
MIQLPEAFIRQMKAQLPTAAESEAFLHSYSLPRTQGLRVHPDKVNISNKNVMQSLQQLFSLEQVPWCETGFYYEEETKPGKHPYHAAGLYYIQEPSAMSAVELLAPEPGDVVLDLAAAPGGKSTHIAGKLAGKGLLISNEIQSARAKILSENIERMGVRNAVVVSATPQQLAERFPQFFDKMMVDAPCSGEGMFRKDPDAISEWSPAHVDMCAARQLDILESAIVMLKPGGRIAYSTCTFNELENERMVDTMLERFPQLKLERTERIWPHLHRGEGHFVAVLRLEDAVDEASSPAGGASARGRSKGKRGASRPEDDALRIYSSFAAETLQVDALPLENGEPLLFGEQLYWLPVVPGGLFSSASLQGLKVLRPGLHLSEIKKGRAEPSHALALALNSDSDAQQSIRLESAGEQVTRYLRGETLESTEAFQGWVLVTVDGYPLGWGKQSAGQVKNHYPKGLRR